MNHQALEKEILRSWKNCARAGLSPDQPTPTPPLKDRQLERLRTEHGRAITALEASISEVRRELPDHMAFLMTDAPGHIGKKKCRRTGGFPVWTRASPLRSGTGEPTRSRSRFGCTGRFGRSPSTITARFSADGISARSAPSVHADALPRHCDGAGIHHPAPPHAARPPLPRRCPTGTGRACSAARRNILPSA